MKRFVILRVEQNCVNIVEQTSYAQLVRLFDCLSYDEKVDLLAEAYTKRMQMLSNI